MCEIVHRMGSGDKMREKKDNSVIHGPYNIIYLSKFFSLRRSKEAGAGCD